MILAKKINEMVMNVKQKSSNSFEDKYDNITLLMINLPNLYLLKILLTSEAPLLQIQGGQ